MRRPDVFTLDYGHPLAQGLVFAGLAGAGDITAAVKNKSLINVPILRKSGATVSRVFFDERINRHSFFTKSVADSYTCAVKPILTEPFTIAAWLEYDAGRGTISNGASFGLPQGYAQINGVGLKSFWNGATANPRVMLNRVGTSLEYNLPDANKAQLHICGVYKSSTLRSLYVDGVLVAENTTNITTNISGSLVSIGSDNSYGYHHGGIADPVIYNRTLSPAEIALLADRADPMLGGLIVEERPVLYFDMGGSTEDALTATDLVTGSPALGTPALGQVHALTATGIATSAPVLGAPALGQVHELTATALTVSSPVLGTPAVGQIHSLTASTLVVGSPVLGTPLLTENAPDVDALTANDLMVSSPVLGSPSFGQIHVFGSDGLVTGAPVLGTPALEINADHLVAADLVVDSPVLGAPAVGQVHILSAVNLSVSAPVLGTPSLEIGKDHLAAADLVVEGPVLGTPALQQIHALVAGFSTSAPVLDAPALRQVHTLIADGLSVSSPVLGTPMLFDLEYVLQTRAELKSTGTTDFTASSFGTTHVELRCYGNYEVNEFGE